MGSVRATALTSLRRQWPVVTLLLILVVVDFTGTTTWNTATAVMAAQMVATSIIAMAAGLDPKRAAIATAGVVAAGSVLLLYQDRSLVGLHVASLASWVVVIAEVI